MKRAPEQDELVRPYHVGQVWIPGKAVQPCVLSVARSICESGPTIRSRNVRWFLDYSFTPFGRCRVGSINAPWRERQPFEAHLYPPRTPYWEDTSSAGVARTRGMFISFTGGELVLRAAFQQRSYVRFLDPSRRLGSLFERMLEIGLGLRAAGFDQAQAVFWEIIALLNASAARDHETRLIPDNVMGAPVSDFLQAVRAYLQEHLAERIRRGDLARHLHLSVSTLAHRYHTEAGETLRATLLQLRLNTVKSLVLKGYALKLVAARTGFYDEYHLSHTFKRVEGISIREFRRRQARTPGRLQSFF